MVVSEAEAATVGGLAAEHPVQASDKRAGVLVKPPYYKRFFKQLWTLLYHKQGRRTSFAVRTLSTIYSLALC